MFSTSFRVALSALFFAGALGLASTGAVQAQSIMKQCGDDWKAAKANNTTNGMTWQEFLKQCRTQKESSAAPAATPAAAPAAAPAPAPAPAPVQTYQPKPVPAQTAARATGAGQFTTAGKRRRAARQTKWSGSTPNPTFTITRAPAATARPSKAPICAKPTPAPRATAPRRAELVSRSSSRKSAESQGGALPQIGGMSVEAQRSSERSAAAERSLGKA